MNDMALSCLCLLGHKFKSYANKDDKKHFQWKYEQKHFLCHVSLHLPTCHDSKNHNKDADSSLLRNDTVSWGRKSQYFKGF